MKILACPFCGCEEGEIVIIDCADREGTPQVVKCVECGAQGPFGYTMEKAIAYWEERFKEK
ncbi:MAG: Lar family restriction alleviation protein [Patescibacteria group bacterium]|jgi:Lar family restriction alleviation protein